MAMTSSSVKRTLTPLIFLGMLCVKAQAQEVPVLMEGKIDAINAVARKISVMGLTVNLPSTVVISTPAGRIYVRDLGGAPLPSRSQPGFLGGIAIVSGRYVSGQIQADTVEITPEENVLSGPVFLREGQFTILGKPITLIQDARMPAKATNAGGFPVLLETAPEGAEATAEGYVGEDGVFYAFHVECDSAKMPSGINMITVSLAQGDEDRLEVRGYTTSSSGTVRIVDAVTLKKLGEVPVSPTSSYGAFTASFRNLDQLPSSIKLVHSAGAKITVRVTEEP